MAIRIDSDYRVVSCVRVPIPALWIAGRTTEEIRAEESAEASGVDSYRYKTIAISLSAALTAFAGSFYAQFYLYVSPDTVLVFEPQLTMMLGTMVGGAGTAFGPVIGSLLFSGLGEALRNLPFLESTRGVVIGSKMVYAVLLIVVLIYLPGGLITLGRKGA